MVIYFIWIVWWWISKPIFSLKFLSFLVSVWDSFLLDNLGTHISNTREAKAFALLAEEGIAKGIRRITAVTTDRASDAMKMADDFEKQVDEAAKLEGSLLEEVGIGFYLSKFW
jgi:hypothetical protein